jgi:hypothetical protein
MAYRGHDTDPLEPLLRDHWPRYVSSPGYSDNRQSTRAQSARNLSALREWRAVPFSSQFRDMVTQHRRGADLARHGPFLPNPTPLASALVSGD